MLTGDIYDTINLLEESISIAKSHKINDENIIIDPSIGFFRKEGNNPFFSKIEGLDWYIRDLDILSNIAIMRYSLNKPVCISISRKSFIGAYIKSRNRRKTYSFVKCRNSLYNKRCFFNTNSQRKRDKDGGKYDKSVTLT